MRLLLALLSIGIAAHGQSPTRIVAMEYPWLARWGVIQGKVELVAAIPKEGGAAVVHVTSGHPLLSEPAKEMLEKWRFGPCALTDCDVTFTLTFELSGSCVAGSNCPSGFEVDLPGKIKITAKAFLAIVN